MWKHLTSHCKAAVKSTKVNSHGNNVCDLIIVHAQTYKQTDAENVGPAWMVKQDVGGITLNSFTMHHT